MNLVGVSCFSFENLYYELEAYPWVELAQRTALVALPFISLYKPAGLVIQVGVHAYKALNSVFGLAQAHDLEEIVELTSRASLATCSVVFACLNMPLALASCVVGELLLDLKGFYDGWQEGNTDKMISMGLSILTSSLYVTMLCTGLPEVILISLIMQAILELWLSYEEFQSDRWLEGIAHMALAVVRGFQSIPSAKGVYEKWTAPKVKLVSFNILSDTTLGWFKEDVEKRPDDYAWEERIVRISGTLEKTNADVICLQEVEPKSYEYLCKTLGNSYDSRHDLNDNKKFGLALFVKKSFVKIESVHRYRYEDTTGRIAQVADLRVNGKKIVVGNTHLDQPRRVLQIDELANHLKNTHRNSSLIACGDFNAQHTEDVTFILEKHGLSHDYTAGPTNTHQNTEAKTIDHVFHTQDLDSSTKPLIKIDLDTILPNKEIASDHVPLVSSLSWNYKEVGKMFYDRFWDSRKVKMLVAEANP